jgi:hypothetical protein
VKQFRFSELPYPSLFHILDEVENRMKARTLVVLGIAVAIAVGLTLPLASAYSGASGVHGFYGGMMGGGQSSPRTGYGMMGGAGSYGGMMGGYSGYMGNMMYNFYGNVTSWCSHFMSNLFGQGYSQ